MNTVQKGSSPRMRGTPTNVLIDPEEEGLIPTYAGNTCRLCGSQYPSRAHPHVCGEHLLDKVIIW
ncbi:N-Acetyl-D-glucosamine ABC transport system [Rothia aeria]|uniref:N-Acetyl-D-glucosamine ABC transport system n=1 Tax=Rothia aeria TaxID=172042 RepID=A0A2Z5R3R7_9MICC|nr:N-Acetyl-D-glucosamine ABC transport system [Rothia aeria]